MRATDFLSAESNITVAYHGSAADIDTFNTPEIFLAKNADESLQYGPKLYEVWFKGNPKFETPTIYVVGHSQIVKIKRIK